MNDTTQTRGCESRTGGDADVACVQCGAQADSQRLSLPALGRGAFSKPETWRELSERAERVPEIKQCRNLSC